MLTKKLIFAAMFVLMMTAGTVQAGGDAAKGAELATDCADCHGDDGLGDEDVPAIAGLDAAAHAKMLTDFRAGGDSEMVDYAADLSDQDIADIAAYYATLSGG
jgi:cytochrome c553